MRFAYCLPGRCMQSHTFLSSLLWAILYTRSEVFRPWRCSPGRGSLNLPNSEQLEALLLAGNHLIQIQNHPCNFCPLLLFGFADPFLKELLQSLFFGSIWAAS